MKCQRHIFGQRRLGSVILLITLHGLSTNAAEDSSLHIRCETVGSASAESTRTIEVRRSSITAGDLSTRDASPNTGSWQFDGVRAIAYTVPSNTDGFAENFTWEGFFLTPRSNEYLPETGIADRLITQFAFDKGNWTRLAIGLVADSNGQPRLSVELEGFEGRTFGAGDRVVSKDRWHHFALVHEGTAAAATIRWYLDYELTGEIFLGGQANQNTLRPPGTAPMTIGARLKSGDFVNRGFHGLVDEIRLSPRVLHADEFLRSESVTSEQSTETSHIDAKPHDQTWRDRHAWAREQAARWSDDAKSHASIDAFFPPQNDIIDDASFVRRLSLTLRGRIPSSNEVANFLADKGDDKRSRLIDRMLASPERADAWVGYWQDVLAENPSVVFPTLNNSGAFRQWIYESFRDNKPFDQFATELILMETVESDDARPSGFALATGNDSPMAMRSHVAMKAFAAVDLKCARCHDSPVDDFSQSDLFLLASYLNDGPIKVPETSVAAVGKAKDTGTITTSLLAGQTIQPTGLTSLWLKQPEAANELNPVHRSPRGELAALLTSPNNSRFSDVIVNRVWKRYFGVGLIEPVDNWDAEPSQPRLLRFLSASFVESGYDLKALSRLILASDIWQARRNQRQRMTAEQLIDSLFFAVGKDFEAETMGVHATDAGAVHLPKPKRAWQFAALPNERDRPALGMPVNQTIVDVMTTFGWNGNRQQPRSEREATTSALQPLMMFNGLMSQRIVRLSDRSTITELCLQDIDKTQLVNQLFLTFLGRKPDEEERHHFAHLLQPAYENRRTNESIARVDPLSTFQPDWRKHLEPEQTKLMLEARQRVARGEQATKRLTNDFRERVEDIVWVLINSPEFVIVP